MSDVLETEIREMLRAKATDALASDPLAPAPLGRVRARRATNGVAVLAALSAVAVIATTIVGRSTPEPIQPIGPVPKIGATYSIPGEPTDLGYGFGSVWVTTEDAILRIDPETGRVQTRIDSFPKDTTPEAPGPSVNRLAIGSDAVYALVMDDGYRDSVGVLPTIESTTSDGLSSMGVGASISVTPPPEGFTPHWSVVRIDPRSNEIRNSGVFNGSLPISIAADGGVVWVTGWRTDARPDDGLLARVMFSERGLGVQMFDLPPGEPAAVAADETGLWVALDGPDVVVRLDPRDAGELARVQVDNPVDLVLDEEEMFVSTIDSDQWGYDRIDKETLAGIETTGVGSRRDDMVAEMAGASNYVWVVLEAETNLLRGGLYWIDRITGEVVDRMDVPSFSRQIAPGDGVLWMTGGSTGDAKLYRLDLPSELQ